MKRNPLQNICSLLLLALLTMIFYTSCEKEEALPDIPDQTITTFEKEEIIVSIDEARKWFEEKKQEIENIENFDDSNSCSNSLLNPTRLARWDLAVQTATEQYNIIELPIIFEDNTYPMVLLKDLSATHQIGQQYDGSQGRAGLVLRLVIIQDKTTGQFFQGIMKIVPDPHIDHTDLHKNNILDIQANFKGHITYYGWDGIFLGGYTFNSGMIEASITEEKPMCGSETQIVKTRDVVCTTKFITEVTHNITDWYVNGVYVDSQYDGITTNTYSVQICTDNGNGSNTISPGSGSIGNSGGILIITGKKDTDPCGQDGGAHCPDCEDGIQNNNETGVDCGGDCSPCEEEEEEQKEEEYPCAHSFDFIDFRNTDARVVQMRGPNIPITVTPWTEPLSTFCESVTAIEIPITTDGKIKDEYGNEFPITIPRYQAQRAAAEAWAIARLRVTVNVNLGKYVVSGCEGFRKDFNRIFTRSLRQELYHLQDIDQKKYPHIFDGARGTAVPKKTPIYDEEEVPINVIEKC